MRRVCAVVLILSTGLLWGQGYNLDNCATSIDDNVPEFFKKYFHFNNAIR